MYLLNLFVGKAEYYSNADWYGHSYLFLFCCFPTSSPCIVLVIIRFPSISYHISLVAIALNVAFIYTTDWEYPIGLVEACNIVYNNQSSLTWDFTSH